MHLIEQLIVMDKQHRDTQCFDDVIFVLKLIEEYLSIYYKKNESLLCDLFHFLFNITI